MSGYASASQLVDRPGGHVLDLATALGRTPVGLVDHPDFFDGLLAHPDVAAAALLTVADVAASRYADLGQAKRLAHVDPVVTAGGDRLRFEAFSACNGVYARFDLLPSGIDAGRVGAGTTNVDINHDLRVALAGVGPAELLHLGVGADGLRVTTPDQHHVERPVDLADRWIRGLAETPLLLRDVEQVATVTGVAIGQLLTGLPLGPGPGPTVFLRPTQRGLRPVPSEGEGTVRLAGTTRLGAARRIARFATGLDVYAGPQGTSAWSFELPGGRLILFLTSSAWRGFSGEGSLLELLAAGQAEGDGAPSPDAWPGSSSSTPSRWPTPPAWTWTPSRRGWPGWPHPGGSASTSPSGPGSTGTSRSTPTTRSCGGTHGCRRPPARRIRRRQRRPDELGGAERRHELRRRPRRTPPLHLHVEARAPGPRAGPAEHILAVLLGDR